MASKKERRIEEIKAILIDIIPVFGKDIGDRFFAERNANLQNSLNKENLGSFAYAGKIIDWYFEEIFDFSVFNDVLGDARRAFFDDADSFPTTSEKIENFNKKFLEKKDEIFLKIKESLKNSFKDHRDAEKIAAIMSKILGDEYRVGDVLLWDKIEEDMAERVSPYLMLKFLEVKGAMPIGESNPQLMGIRYAFSVSPDDLKVMDFATVLKDAKLFGEEDKELAEKIKNEQAVNEAIDANKVKRKAKIKDREKVGLHPVVRFRRLARNKIVVTRSRSRVAELYDEVVALDGLLKANAEEGKIISFEEYFKLVVLHQRYLDAKNRIAKPKYDVKTKLIAAGVLLPLGAGAGYGIYSAIDALMDNGGTVIEEPGDEDPEENNEALFGELETVRDLSGLNEEDYTPESWAALQDAVKNNEGVTEDSAKEDIQAAIDDIKAAKDGLVEKEVENPGDNELYNELQEARDISGLNENDYTPESWQALLDALRDYEDLNEDSSEVVIQAAIDDIKAAKDGLVEKEVENPGDNELYNELQEVRDISGLNADDYTAESWAALLDVIQSYGDLDENSPEEDIQTAIDDIQDAIDNLVEKGSTDAGEIGGSSGVETGVVEGTSDSFEFDGVIYRETAQGVFECFDLNNNFVGVASVIFGGDGELVSITMSDTNGDLISVTSIGEDGKFVTVSMDDEMQVDDEANKADESTDKQGENGGGHRGPGM